MLKIIESKNKENLCNFFQQLDDVCLEEAQQFIFDLFKVVQTKYGNFDIALTKETANDILNELNYDKKTIETTSKILNDILDDLYNQKYKNNQHILYRKKSKKKSKKDEKKPSALISGGIEIYPTPDSNVTNGLWLWYIENVSDMSDSDDEPDVPLGYEDLCIDYATGMAKMTQGETDEGQLYLSNFAVYLSDMTQEQATRADDNNDFVLMRDYVPEI